jgi:hypothetical protein
LAIWLLEAVLLGGVLSAMMLTGALLSGAAAVAFGAAGLVEEIAEGAAMAAFIVLSALAGRPAVTWSDGIVKSE